ncbi:ABC transporter ATP-binding protein [Subtercola lobariae]|uniref:Peptide ABC transporter ATP-binding protein n=1 Tax=Subtercola lobariae TaxID=1588641 RepID=A0A917EYB3_9MICO|nr:ATP-binding cassette domain-containing protein [Subtercola lobariae]GGF33661.1 peptide ABC transporter ATP-binding protein [Subtercola lobariae]
MSRHAEAVLEGVGLAFGYARDAFVFSEWSERFVPGEIVALTGASGRGKSTLLYVLGLMTRPTAGEVLLGGHPVGSLSDRERAWLRATRLGFVFQDAALDPARTILDNVVETSLYRRADRRGSVLRARGLLERFGVEHRVQSRPGQISGGQAQRIALCRALMNDPQVLLADEPTGNLDQASAAVVLGAFRERAEQGAAVVIATHDGALMAQCDRRIEL